jgi:starch synthase (maltosyl-transferring)
MTSQVDGTLGLQGSRASGDQMEERAIDSIVIENVYPELDGGRFPVKRTVGDVLEVRADIFRPGRGVIEASLKYRKSGSGAWREAAMEYLDNDRWTGSFVLDEVGTYEYAVEAWTNGFATAIDSVQKWSDAGEDIAADLTDLRRIIEAAIAGAPEPGRSELSKLYDEVRAAGAKDALELASAPRFSQLMREHSVRKDTEKHRVLNVVVDRDAARFAAWYEMFPRSQGTVPGKSGTFGDCERRLPEIQRMGFDVLYLPPVHPIGRTNRRGKNNSPVAGSADPGSPWAIGSELGGHMSIDPDLGSMDDFRHLLASAKKMGIEVALDLALQCSPDHPYVAAHPEWFFHRSDGSIRYAENPPKKYFDIYPLDFDNERWRELWQEVLDIVLFWIDKGVTTFRVDNPHTKPFGFWEWLIQSVKERYPAVLFLAEAFTRPKPMKRLAKLGFSESYTYFTWKNTKAELTEFLTEFVVSEAAEYYRGNFFTNTPDILSEYLQSGGVPAFKIRVALAATLSSLYGIYNGYELCENRAVAPGSEEYLDSEKYQYKVRDWDIRGNIKDYITKLNSIRRSNPSLQLTSNLRLLPSDNDAIFFYGKWTAERSDVILVAVNLDPFKVQDSMVSVPIDELGIAPDQSYHVLDLMTDIAYQWKGKRNYVKLDPKVGPAHVFLVKE